MIAPFGGLLDLKRYFCWSAVASRRNPTANRMTPMMSCESGSQHVVRAIAEVTSTYSCRAESEMSST
jgi:hypothetical protein